ncbi:hypothetical protein BHE74_00042618 [Ensete ventricosum]|nr:hypothetical protein BHE74_00042618 [Ensete ventricosum]
METVHEERREHREDEPGNLKYRSKSTTKRPVETVGRQTCRDEAAECNWKTTDSGRPRTRDAGVSSHGIRRSVAVGVEGELQRVASCGVTAVEVVELVLLLCQPPLAVMVEARYVLVLAVVVVVAAVFGVRVRRSVVVVFTFVFFFHCVDGKQLKGFDISRHVSTRGDDSGTLAAAGGWGDVHGEPLLLSLPGLVVLEPVKDVLPFDLAVLPEPG